MQKRYQVLIVDDAKSMPKMLEMDDLTLLRKVKNFNDMTQDAG